MKGAKNMSEIQNAIEVMPQKVKVDDFPLFLRQRGQSGCKIPVCEDNPLTTHHNRVLLVGVYEIGV